MLLCLQTTIINLAFLVTSLAANAQFMSPPMLGSNLYTPVQSTSVDGDGSVAVPFTGPNSGGHLLIAVVYDSAALSTPSTLTVTDSAGSTWIALPPVNGGRGWLTQIWFVPNAVASSSNTVTVADSSGTPNLNVITYEYAGLAQTNIVDAQILSSVPTYAATTAAGSLTTRTSDFIFGAIASDAPVTAMSSGYQFVSLDAALAVYGFSGSLKGALANTSASPTATLGQASPFWAESVVAFRGLHSIMPIAPTALAISSAALNTPTWSCSPVAIQTKDSGGTARVLQKQITVGLSGTNLLYYSDSSCQQAISSVQMWAGQSAATFYVQMTAAGSLTLTTSVTGGYNSPTQTEVATLQPYTWIGGTSTAWATASNWSNATVPSSTSSVYFDSNCTTNCSVQMPATAVTVANFQMESKYTGTITAGSTGASLTVTTTFQDAGGTWTGTAASATTVGNFFLLAGGKMTLNSALAITGNSIISTGTFTPNSKLITLTGSAILLTQSLQINSSVTYNKAGGTFTVPGTFSFQPSTLTISAGTVTIGTSPMDTAALYGVGLNIASGGTLNLNGQGSDNFNGAVTVSSGGTLNLNDFAALNVFAAITNAGTIAGNSTAALEFAPFSAASITNTGTINLPNAQLFLVTFANLTFTGNMTYRALTVNNTLSTSVTLTFSAGNTFTFTAGLLSIAGTSAAKILFRSSTAGTQFKISTTVASTIGPYVDIKDSNNIGAVALHAGPNYTNSGNNSNWSFP